MRGISAVAVKEFWALVRQPQLVLLLLVGPVLWGYFEASLEFPAFEGAATLRVGGVSPRDGSFEGVEVPVT